MELTEEQKRRLTEGLDANNKAFEDALRSAADDLSAQYGDIVAAAMEVLVEFTDLSMDICTMLAATELGGALQPIAIKKLSGFNEQMESVLVMAALVAGSNGKMEFSDECKPLQVACAAFAGRLSALRAAKMLQKHNNDATLSAVIGRAQHGHGRTH